MKTITTVDGRKYNRVSRWIHIEYRTVTPRHSLYDYADDGELICFRHNGRLYALGQFMRLTAPEYYEDVDGKMQFLSGYDCTEWYKPYVCEIDDGGEYIRLYQETN